LPPSNCSRCGVELRRGNMKAGTKMCYSCYSQQRAMQPTDYVAVTPQPAAQLIYQQPQSVVQPVHKRQAAAQPQPTTQTTQTFKQQAPQPAFLPDKKNPGVAAILSFFWAGLGQIYNGQLMKGIGFIVLYAICVLLCFFLIGLLILPTVWIIGIWDAYRTAKLYNDRMYANLAR